MIRCIDRSSFVIIVLFISILGAFLGAFGQAGDSAHDEYLYARRLYDEGYYDLASQQLERYLRDYPDRLDAVEAQFLLGEAYLQAGQLDRSRGAFMRVALVNPDAPRAAEALFKVGEVLEKMGRNIDAAQTYRRINGFYSKDRFAPLGLQRAATLYVQAGDTTKAMVVGEEMLELFPNAEAANLMRLQLAGIFAAKGTNERAYAYLQKALERTGTDSIAAKAQLVRARLYRQEWRIAEAIDAYYSVLDRYKGSPDAAQARLDLGGLLIFLGRVEEAREILAVVSTDEAERIRAMAEELTGDSYYREQDLTRALEHYKKAEKLQPRTSLKVAWVLEKTGRMKQAFQKYSTLTQGRSAVTHSARIRAAYLAWEQGNNEVATELWSRAIADSIDPILHGKVQFSLAQAMLASGKSGIREVIDRMQALDPPSPFIDDVYYLWLLEAVKNEEYSAAILRGRELIDQFPASPLSDSAMAKIKFLKRHKIKGERLIEKMAELSSQPQEAVGATQWALNWGDFYLDDFKEPVKAIDHYDRILDEILATTDVRLHALYKTARAYLQLYEAALYEDDPIGVEMYSDSVGSSFESYYELDPNSDKTFELWTEIILVDLRRRIQESSLTANYLDSLYAFVYDAGEERIPVPAMIAIAGAELELGREDSLIWRRLLKFTENSKYRTKDRRELGRLGELQVETLSEFNDSTAALDTAQTVFDKYPLTPGGAEAWWWSMHQPLLPVSLRLESLEHYKKSYPYLLDSQEHILLEAQLLDSLGRPLEALILKNAAREFSEWMLPDIDILKVPGALDFFQRARAYLAAGQSERTVVELHSLLNLEPGGELSPLAYLDLARIHAVRGEVTRALAYLDTLTQRFPYSVQADGGARLRPRMVMDSGNYTKAVKLFQDLASKELNSDSSYYYLIQATVCLYKANRLEEAYRSAKDLYDRFEDRADLDDVKARFHLEKGRAYARMKDFREARDQFDVILDKYTYSPWFDDASYEKALTYLSGKKPEEGCSALELFIENNPDSPYVMEAQLRLGMSSYEQDEYAGAMAALGKVWEGEAEPGLWLSAYRGLLQLYRDLRYWDAAIRLTRDYLERFPGAPEALDRKMDIAQFYLQLGEWDEAIRYYRPLLPLADVEREAEIQYYIGEAYQQKGDYQTAILEFLKVDVLGRKTKLDWGVTALYQAGICYEKLGDYQGANRMYSRIIKDTGIESNYGRAARKRLDDLPNRQ